MKKDEYIMYQQLILMRGLPGSGKSTFAKQLVDENPAKIVRVSRDDIRRMLSPVWSQDIEAIVYQIKESAINNALSRGYSVVVDECHSKVQAKDYIGYLERYGVDVVFYDVRTDLERCIENNRKREGVAQVQEEYIREINDRFNWNDIDFPTTIHVKYHTIDNKYIELRKKTLHNLKYQI